MARPNEAKNVSDLVGVKIPGGRILGRAIRAHEVTYSEQVLHQPESGGDLRRAPRRRTRLRSGKLLDMDGTFICHCRIHDRSLSGLRIELETSCLLPERYLVLDDETQTFSVARTVWRNGATTIGVRLWPSVTPSISRADMYALRSKYYGVPKR